MKTPTFSLSSVALFSSLQHPSHFPPPNRNLNPLSFSSSFMIHIFAEGDSLSIHFHLDSPLQSTVSGERQGRGIYLLTPCWKTWDCGEEVSFFRDQKHPFLLYYNSCSDVEFALFRSFFASLILTHWVSFSPSRDPSSLSINQSFL